MRPRWIKRWITAAALLPLLILAVSAGRFSQFRCLMTGETMVSPCCPGLEGLAGAAGHADGAAEVPAGDTLAAEDCCSREEIEIARPLAAPPAAAAGFDDHFVGAVAVVSWPSTALLVSSRIVARAAGWEPPRPPLLLVKRSLLI